MKTLRERILMAGPVKVAEILDLDVLRRLPPTIGPAFAGMRIEWISSRVWGLSFQLGDEVVKLGHRRGDHIASRPWIHGLSLEEGEEFLRLSVEGTALHELGHAVLDAYKAAIGPRTYDAFLAGFKEAVLLEGPPSSYFGHEANASWEDALHEVYAEAFRYMLSDTSLAQASPLVAAAAAIPLNAVSARLEMAP